MAKRTIERLYDLLKKQGFQVEWDKFSDDSGQWLEYRKNDSKVHIVFSFDGKGQDLEDISVWKDIVEVTDQKRLM